METDGLRKPWIAFVLLSYPQLYHERDCSGPYNLTPNFNENKPTGIKVWRSRVICD